MVGEQGSEAGSAQPSWGAEDKVCLALTLVALAAAWWFFTRHVEAKMAMDGFSPLLATDKLLNAFRYREDFDNGATELLNSLPIRLYPLAAILGVPLVPMVALVTGLEIALLAIAAYLAARLFAPQQGQGAACVAALVVTTGVLTSANLSNFSFPFYGWVYGFGYAGAILAIAEAARGSLLRAGFLLALTFSCHPIIAIFAGGCVGLIVLATLSARTPREVILAVLAGAIPSAAWLAIIASAAQIDAGDVPTPLFVALTRTFNYHWHPVQLGVFDIFAERGIIPMLSALALGAVAVDSVAERPLKRIIFLCCAALMVVAAIGLVASLHPSVPLLMKLAIQRASGLVSVLLAIFVGLMIWRDMRQGTPLEKGASAFVAISAFASGAYSVGVLPVLCRVGVHLWTKRAGLGVAPQLAFVLAVAAAAYTYLAHSQGWLTSWTDALHIGIWWGALVGLAVAFGGRHNLTALAVVALMVAASVLWSQRSDTLRSPARLARAGAFVEAQLWAKANTAEGSLFLLDPAQGYGWRDLSQRPSFGGLRDWLHTSFIYNTRRTLLDEGIRRANLFGLDLRSYVGLHLRPSIEAGDLLTSAIRSNFYTADAAFFRQLAQREGIDYVVFERRFMAAPAPLPVVFSNDYFIITEAREPNDE